MYALAACDAATCAALQRTRVPHAQELVLSSTRRRQGRADRGQSQPVHRRQITEHAAAAVSGILVTAMVAMKPMNHGAFLISTMLLVIVGVFDDRYNTWVSTRLAAQICAAIVMMLGGDMYLRDIG